MIVKRALGVVALIVVGAALAACGERPQVVDYKQGKYQGKPDTQPWANAPFNGNKDEWERAIKNRNQGQNEYKRIG